MNLSNLLATQCRYFDQGKVKVVKISQPSFVDLSCYRLNSAQFGDLNLWTDSARAVK